MNKSIKDIARPFFSRFGLGLSAFLLAIAAFVYIATRVTKDQTQQFDQQLLLAVNQTSSGWQDNLWLFITQLGGFVAVLLAVSGIVLYLLRKKRYIKATIVTAGVAGAVVLNTVLKLIFERGRPDLWEQLINQGFHSFPSGHAMASSALALSLVVIMWNSRWRLLVALGGCVYVLMVSYSRLYLGVHYPTDIIAGWTVSLAWVLLVVGIVRYRWLFRRRGTHGPDDTR